MKLITENVLALIQVKRMRIDFVLVRSIVKTMFAIATFMLRKEYLNQHALLAVES